MLGFRTVLHWTSHRETPQFLTRFPCKYHVLCRSLGAKWTSSVHSRMVEIVLLPEILEGFSTGPIPKLPQKGAILHHWPLSISKGNHLNHLHQLHTVLEEPSLLRMDEIRNRTTLKPWEITVCWYFQGNHHSMVSQVMRNRLASIHSRSPLDPNYEGLDYRCPFWENRWVSLVDD